MTAGTLHGHIALVTGGSRGIGAAIVRSLAEAGASVAVNYRERASDANALVKIIGEAGGHAIAVAADVSQADAVTRMIQRVTSDLGPIDILINNAGIAITRAIEDLSETDFDQTIAVNLKSVFLCTQAVLPMMRSKGWGRIVNISSRSVKIPQLELGSLQCFEGWRRRIHAWLRSPPGEGRHHRQCCRALSDRNGYDERPAQSRQPDPIRSLWQSQ